MAWQALLGQIERQKISNIRIWPEDARDLMDRLPDRAIARAFLLFPIPGPSRGTAERRFIGRANLIRWPAFFEPGAEFRLASDDSVYLDWVSEHLPAHPAFEPVEGAADRPADWPPTRYEQKALRQGAIPAISDTGGAHDGLIRRCSLCRRIQRIIPCVSLLPASICRLAASNDCEFDGFA